MKSNKEILEDSGKLDLEVQKIGDAFTNYIKFVHQFEKDPKVQEVHCKVGATLTATKLIAFCFVGLDETGRKMLMTNIYEEAQRGCSDAAHMIKYKN